MVTSHWAEVRGRSGSKGYQGSLHTSVPGSIGRIGQGFYRMDRTVVNIGQVVRVIRGVYIHQYRAR